MIYALLIVAASTAAQPTITTENLDWNWIQWRTSGATVVVIEDVAAGRRIGADRPPRGSVILPAGRYRFTARGPSGRAHTTVVIP